MYASKLMRMENGRWDPPILRFDVERHGAMKYGSTRAEIQSWAVDVQAGSAEIEGAGRRQIRPMAVRVDVRPLAEEVARMVSAGADDERLRWYPGGDRVRVLIGRIIPDDGYKQTVAGRRRRFAKVLRDALASIGWFPIERSASHTYARQS